MALAGFVFRFSGLDAPLVETARTIFEGFEAGARRGDEQVVDVRVSISARDTFLAFRTTAEPEPYRIFIARDGGAFRFVSYHFAALYEPAARLVRLLLARGPGRNEIRLLENFFRVLASYCLIEEGAVLVHAAALARHGKGYLFYGPSGAGKTTVSRNRGDADLLSDDQGLLTVDGEMVLLSATPFRGGERIHRHPGAIALPNVNRTVPLAGLYHLVQAKDVQVREMPRARQIASLLTAVPIFHGAPYNNARLLDIAAAIVARVPARELHFLPDGSYWDAIEAG